MYEQGTEAVVSLVERTEDRLRLLSSLAIVEVRSAINRKLTRREITESEAADAIILLSGEVRRVIEIPISASVVQRACEIVDSLQLRALDAIQLATALQFIESEAESQIVFVSADAELLRAASKAGLEVLDPCN